MLRLLMCLCVIVLSLTFLCFGKKAIGLVSVMLHFLSYYVLPIFSPLFCSF